MQRRREIAAAPKRGASEAWRVIAELVCDTLARSSEIAKEQVAEAMKSAVPAGTMLIAGGHLERHPLVVVAPPVHLSITVVSGDKALTLDESLDPVPGAATATEWTVYLPTPDPLGAVVRKIAATSPHLSANAPPSEAESASQATSIAPAIDRNALARRAASR